MPIIKHIFPRAGPLLRNRWTESDQNLIRSSDIIWLRLHKNSARSDRPLGPDGPPKVQMRSPAEAGIGLLRLLGTAGPGPHNSRPPQSPTLPSTLSPNPCSDLSSLHSFPPRRPLQKCYTFGPCRLAGRQLVRLPGSGHNCASPRRGRTVAPNRTKI